MKILQVTPGYFPCIGGVEAHVADISRYLAKAGFDVEVYTTEPSGKSVKREVIDGINVTRFPAIAPRKTTYFSYPLCRALMRTKADIIHAHNYRALPMLFAALTKKQDTRLVVTTHLGFSKVGRWIYYIYNPLLGRIIFDRADKIIIVSPAELDELPLLKNYEHKTVHIPNGVDFSEIDRHNLGNRQAKPTVDLLCVSRIERKKGIDVAIKAMDYLRELSVRLNIVGDGPDMERLIHLTNGLGLEHLISFKGRVTREDLCVLHSRSDIFLLLSEYEAHSVALTEAMAFGLVPIVSRVGGNHYIVDSEIGYILDYPADPHRVSTTVRELAINRSVLMNKGRKARDKAIAEFNVKNTLKHLTELYESLK